MNLPLGPDSSSLSPERAERLSAEKDGQTPEGLAHRTTISQAFEKTFTDGAGAERAFQAAVGRKGFEGAVGDLEAGAFGTLRPDAALPVSALAASVRVGRDIDEQLASGTLNESAPNALSQNADGPLDWVLGVLQGDFNQNPSVSQTIANTILSMVPGLDQIADARDVVANLLQIRENPRSTAAWTGLTLTLAGLVPTVGSAAKGAARLALNGRSGAVAFEALRRLGVEQPGRFLADQARTIGRTVSREFDAVVGGLADALASLGRFSPQLAAAAGDVRAIQRQAPVYLNRAVQDVEARLAHVANRTPTRVASPERVSRALAGFTPRQFHIAGRDLVLGQSDMRHILTRHHPDFWDGSTKEVQSFLDRRMSVQDVENAIAEVLRQNRGRFASGDLGPAGRIEGVVDGVRYRVGFSGGRIGQFYSPLPSAR